MSKGAGRVNEMSFPQPFHSGSEIPCPGPGLLYLSITESFFPITSLPYDAIKGKMYTLAITAAGVFLYILEIEMQYIVLGTPDIIPGSSFE